MLLNKQQMVIFKKIFFLYYKLTYSVHKHNYMYSWTIWVHIYKPWENSCLFNLTTSWYSSVDKYLATFRPYRVYLDIIYFLKSSGGFFFQKIFVNTRSRQVSLWKIRIQSRSLWIQNLRGFPLSATCIRVTDFRHQWSHSGLVAVCQ